MLGRIALLPFPTRVMDVVTAVITAKGEFTMTTSDPEATTLQAAPADTAAAPEASTKATRAPHARRVAPGKAKSGKKTTPTKESAKAKKGAKVGKPAKAAKAPKPKASGPREGSKTEAILALLKRPDGATLQELMKATSWQPHSVRGFLSATVGKKMGLAVESVKGEDGERRYSVKG
jgi:hypothetical protein